MENFKDSKIYRFGKPFLILILVFTILFIISYFIFQTGKKDKHEDIVYTKFSEKIRLCDRSLPVINLKGKEVKKINKEIERMFYQNEKYRFRNFYYDYDVDGDILSLVIHKSYLPDSAIRYINEYYAYYINIKTNKQVTDDYILKKYNFTKEEVSDIVKTKMNDMYLQELEEKAIDKICNFKCYLDKRNMDYDFSNITIGIKDKHLVGYVPFYTYNEFSKKEYTKDDFLFELKK